MTKTASAAAASAGTTSGLDRKLMKGLRTKTWCKKKAQTSSWRICLGSKETAQNGSKWVQLLKASRLAWALLCQKYLKPFKTAPMQWSKTAQRLKWQQTEVMVVNMALSQISRMVENWKPRFSSMSQKSKIVFNFFPINNPFTHLRMNVLMAFANDDFSSFPKLCFLFHVRIE